MLVLLLQHQNIWVFRSISQCYFHEMFASVISEFQITLQKTIAELLINKSLIL